MAILSLLKERLRRVDSEQIKSYSHWPVSMMKRDYLLWVELHTDARHDEGSRRWTPKVFLLCLIQSVWQAQDQKPLGTC